MARSPGTGPPSSRAHVPSDRLAPPHAARARRALLCAGGLALVLLAAGGAPAEDTAESRLAASAATAVDPKLNARFLSPDLDVDEWIEVFEGESREIFAARREIVDALELRPGMRIADVGAGTGFFSALFAERVGETGRVFATEISPGFVAHLRARKAELGLETLEVVHNDARSAKLPEASIDVAFLCDVYHHFEHPDAMLRSLSRALRPGGRLIVIDFERIPGQSRDWVIRHVRAGKGVFRREIEAAGFVSEGEGEVAGLEENYLLRFRRP